MAARDIEMMHDVAERILIREHARARLRRELEAQAPLAAVAARLHAHLHHAFADGHAVGEAVGVPDRVWISPVMRRCRFGG